MNFHKHPPIQNWVVLRWSLGRMMQVVGHVIAILLLPSPSQIPLPGTEVGQQFFQTPWGIPVLHEKREKEDKPWPLVGQMSACDERKWSPRWQELHGKKSWLLATRIGGIWGSQCGENYWEVPWWRPVWPEGSDSSPAACQLQMPAWLLSGSSILLALCNFSNLVWFRYFKEKGNDQSSS